MDIMGIVQTVLHSVNLKDILIGLFSGAIIIKLLDEIFIRAITKFWPEKALEVALNKIREFDDKYIDPLKEKYPKAGAEVENKIAIFLNRVENIILDK